MVEVEKLGARDLGRSPFHWKAPIMIIQLLRVIQRKEVGIVGKILQTNPKSYLPS